MTEDELRGHFEKAYKIIRRERRMRERLLRGENARIGVAEMDLLLEIITTWKDELKPHCEPVAEQGVLLDVPRKGEYL